MSPPRTTEPDPHADGARERIVQTAYDLFCRWGVQSIGVDRVVAEAQVAKTTLYRHFRSKNDLILAVLERREQLWTRDWLFSGIQSRAKTPEKQLLAIFDLFDEWFRRPGYEGCLFINTMLETHDLKSPVHKDSVRRLANIRKRLRTLAEEAGIGDPEPFAHRWHLLMLGAIVSASNGNHDAAHDGLASAAPLLKAALRSA